LFYGLFHDSIGWNVIYRKDQLVMLIFFVQHLYFLAAIYFTIFWMLFFVVIKKGRIEILKMSFAGLILGPLVELMHLNDWWRPHFIFNSFIKIEDLLFGFSIAGIASAVYIIIQRPETQDKLTPKVKSVMIFIALIILFGTFYFWHTSSFLSSILCFSFSIILASVKNSNTLLSIVFTGFFVLILATPGYLFGIYINPTWIQQEWILSKLSGIMLMGIPIEEFIWFFFAGMGIAAFQEYFLF